MSAIRLAALAIGIAFLCANGGPAWSQPSMEDLERRRAIAESGDRLAAAWGSLLAASVTPAELSQALDVPESMLAGVSVSGPSSAHGAFSSLGVIQPQRGPSFVVMSSGAAGTTQPEPGIDFAPAGTAGDRVVLTLTLDLPEGVNRLEFDFDFLSAEFPDFIGSAFNDTFLATLTDGSGVREIARASVNGSSFFAASATRAGGSGFDIFTENPSGVDTSFPGGLPDAGLTGRQSVSASVTGGESVTLRFSIEDRGDGILDSAVVLDNLILSSVEILDPNPDLLANGSVVTDPEALAQGGEVRRGVAADGATRLLLRSAVAGPGSVDFCLDQGTAPADGGLALPGDSGLATCVAAPVVDTSQGFMAFAVYRAPEDFNQGGHEDLASRPLAFRTTYFPSGTGSPVESVAPFDLVRPPLVLIHGLWSDAGTWTFPVATDARFDVTPVNYEASHADSFAENRLVPFERGVREAIAGLRARSIAATRVDVAGHSMGGILGRNHVALPIYERSANFNEGDFHKLITLNTPHTGSPLANLVNIIRAHPFYGPALEAIAAAAGHPVDRGALDDLAKGSAAIGAIQATPVPSHAVVGVGGSDALELVPGVVGDIYTVVNFFADSSGLFQGLQHDGVVGRRSQEGGIPPSATTVFGGPGSIHFFVTEDGDYSDQLVDLLNSPTQGPLFAEFPAPSSVSSLSASAQSALLVPTATGSSLVALQFAAPPDGFPAVGGDLVDVYVDVIGNADVERVLLVAPGIAMVDEAAPFDFEVPIPLEAVGDLSFAAVGLNGAGDVFTSDTTSVRVLPPATLESVRILPADPILFEVGETRELALFGSYSDGVLRKLTEAPGTGYLVSDPGVIHVSADGALTAVGPGVATVVARNQGIQDSMSATVVVGDNVRPVADAGPDQTVSVGAPVVLDGSGSFDPDDGPSPLSFQWQQIDGPPVALSDPFALAPSFSPPIEGPYSFGLVVSDGLADSQPDSVTVTVAPAACDVDANNVIDRRDIEAIFDARGTTASGPSDPMDSNGDGLVTVNDSRECALRCTLPDCEPACGLLGIEPFVVLGYPLWRATRRSRRRA